MAYKYDNENKTKRNTPIIDMINTDNNLAISTQKMATLAISQTSKFSVWSLPEDQSNRRSSKPSYSGANLGLIVEKVEESKLFNAAQDDDGKEGDAQLNQALTMLGGSFAMYDDPSLIML
jgi:hypothetical protein